MVSAVVTGLHKNGKTVSLILSVSPCAARGEFIGILYRQTEADARARAEAKLAKMKNELLDSELRRLMLQVSSNNSCTFMNFVLLKRG